MKAHTPPTKPNPMPKSNFEIITPDRAKDYLSKMVSNRPLNDRNLQAQINLINTGQFMNTGESIKFSWEDKLIDGQHRLMAIIKTGKKQEMLVVRDLDPAAFAHIDTGRTRKTSDVLGIEGITNPARIGAMAKFIMSFQRGQFVAAAKNDMRLAKRITHQDALEFVLKHKDSLYESYLYGYNKNNKVTNGNLLSSFHYIFKAIHESQADDFCHKLATGLDINDKSPIYILRQHFQADLRAKRKMPSLQKMAFIIKAWNMFRTQKTVTSFRWDSVTDPFPKPQ